MSGNDMEPLPKIARERLRAEERGSHPDEDVLAAFAEHSLNEPERQAVLEHLAACGACRQVVALTAGSSKNLPQVATAATGDAAVESAAVSQRARFWMQPPKLGWVAAAGAALAVAIFVGYGWKTRQRGAKEIAQTNTSGQMAQALPAGGMGVAGKPAAGRELASGNVAEPPAAPKAEASRRSGRARRKGSNSLQRDKIAAANSIVAEGARISDGLPAAKRTGPAPRQLEAFAKRAGSGAGTGIAGDVVSPAPARKERESAGLAGGVAEMLAKKRAAVSSERVAKQALGEEAGQVIGAAPAAPAARYDAGSPAAQSGTARSAGVVGSVFGGNANSTRMGQNAQAWMQAASAAVWSLSGRGYVERSVDGGKTRTQVEVGGGAHFRAVTAVGLDVWAGGRGGLLFHSPDGGQHWTRILAEAGADPFVADIARMEFSDALHGRLTTAAGDTWVTVDGGKSWGRM